MAQFLELQIRELQDRAAAAQAAREREAVRGEVGRMVLFLVILTAYSLVLGLTSSVLVVSALVDPESIAQDVRAAAAGGSAAIGAVPGSLVGVVISALTTFGLLLFRGTSTSIRSDLGGVLFVGVAVLCLVGISAAAFTGPFGLLVALPGVVAATVIVGQLCWMLVRLQARAAASHAGQGGQPEGWSSRQLALWSRRLSPVGRPLVTALFAALPALCVLAVGGALLTNGGPLYLPAFASRFVAALWCLWAIVVTPAAARIPLWSALGWGVLITLQLSAYPVAWIIMLAVAVLLYADTLWLVLAGGRTEEHMGRVPLTAAKP